MAKFDEYNIPLKGLKADSQDFEFNLDNQYFKKIDSPEVQQGNVKAKVTVVKKKQHCLNFPFTWTVSFKSHATDAWTI